MKFSYTLLSLGLLTLSPIADAVDVSGVEKKQVWAYGVTEESGWYDYNKTRGGTYDTDDDLMCWAASASNIIAWWQDHNKEAVANLTFLPEDPWNTFRIVYSNVGGNVSTGLNWYINGILDNDQQNLVLPDGYDAKITYDEDGKDKLPDYRWGSFLNPWGAPTGTSVYSTVDNPIRVAATNGNNGYQLCGNIIDALSGGYALGLSCYSEDSSYTIAHAITLWGVEYTGSGAQRQLTKIWVTDSDDKEVGLRGLDINFKETYVAISSEYMRGAEIRLVDGMRTSMPVPEPASATLSLLALAALVSRRRR